MTREQTDNETFDFFALIAVIAFIIWFSGYAYGDGWFNGEDKRLWADRSNLVAWPSL